MKRSVKTARKAASAHAHASQPTDLMARTTCPSRNPCTRVCSAIATRKNVPATKTVMNVVSFVAKESASRAPISAGWWARGRSRNRAVTAISASVIAAM